MTNSEMVILVKQNLGIADTTKDLIINDIIQEVLNYCNITDLQPNLEPFIRKKVKSIIVYETDGGTISPVSVKSLSEGDTTITYGTETTTESIYGLSDSDKKALKSFRRCRK